MASVEILPNIIAGSIAGAIQPIIFNPLDSLRVRFQIADTSGSSAAAFAYSIIKREGFIRGLYLPGQPFNSLAVSSSQGLRYALYPPVRDAIMPCGAMRPDLMALSGFISGSLAYFAAAPLFLLKTRGQAAAQTGSQLEYPSSLQGYWRGSGPMVIRGALLTAGNMMGYDATKKLCTQFGVMSDGPALHVCAATAAAFCAATASAPADVLQTRMQSNSSGQSGGAVRCASAIFRADGIPGFFRGWTISVARLVPTFIVGSTIFEQARALMGLPYFT